MSDLEQQLANLTLKAPGPGLDDRVLAALNTLSCCRESDMGKASIEPAATAPVMTARSASVPGRDPSDRSAQGRAGLVVTSGWLVAAVSLIVGMTAGRWLFPPAWPDSLSSVRHTVIDGARVTPAKDSADQLQTGESLTKSNEVTEVPEFSGTPGRPAEPFSTDAPWFSPSVGAVAWEQQTGEIFRVGTHRSDRRFAMCRECHRVGG